jgi:hypothetical protein
MKAARQLSIPALLLVSTIVTLSFAGDKVRIYVTDSTSWQVGGGIGVSSGSGGGAFSGGARPQTAEIIKTFNERCSDCTITMKKENADFIILLDHEGGKDLILRDNKVAVFNKEGDLIYSGSTRILGNAVKNACTAIRDSAQYLRNPGQQP